VDGGEWLDFVGADLKHLTPRPERTRGNGAARREAVAEDTGAEELEAPAPELIVHAVAEPEPAVEAVHVVAAAEPVMETIAVAPEPAPLNYEPDQERRDKFFSRISRWSKK